MNTDMEVGTDRGKLCSGPVGVKNSSSMLLGWFTFMCFGWMRYVPSCGLCENALILWLLVVERDMKVKEVNISYQSEETRCHHARRCTSTSMALYPERFLSSRL